MLFDDVLNDDSYTLDPYNASTEVNSTSTNTIWDFAADPTGWSSTKFLLAFLGIVGAAGFIGVGAYIITKSDLAILFSIFVVFLSFGGMVMASLYNVFNRDPAMWGCTSVPCATSIFFWVITGGALSIWYVLACYDAWTGRSTS